MPTALVITLKPGFHCPEEISPRSTGLYLAFPTTEVLKPTYRGHKTLVNLEHTKVGITMSSLRSRWSEYKRTFGGEVAFHPLFELSAPQPSIYESRLLDEMHRHFPKSGSAREWFFTTEREKIVAHALSLLAVKDFDI
ncbi:MAG: hypothetical protein WCJ87_11425 [Burkholderiales bacterium]